MESDFPFISVLNYVKLLFSSTWRIQRDPAFISSSFCKQFFFSNIFTRFWSHSNLFRQIIGNFPEDCDCGRLAILFTLSYSCVAILKCIHLSENILHAQRQPSENSNKAKQSEEFRQSEGRGVKHWACKQIGGYKYICFFSNL